MAEASTELTGPDLSTGVPLDSLDEGTPLLGHADGEPVLLCLLDGDPFAVGAICMHYGGPLAEGLVHGDTVRCPWHHACFSLRTGEALRPPALMNLPRWRTEQRDGHVFVTNKLEAPSTLRPHERSGKATSSSPESVVIIGAGPAGAVAAETLRREGYDRPVTIIDADVDATVDRPNLSKDYLAGNAPEDWIPLRPPGFYEENGIVRLQGRRVDRIDPTARRVALDDGEAVDFDALLLAPGAEPIRLPDEVAGGRPVHYLRTLADSRAIISAAGEARRAVLLGASFIGLEVAASLRTRGLQVDIVAPEPIPLARVLGEELGAFVRQLHEDHGVTFHLGHTASAMDTDAVTLDDGSRLDADLVVAGIGVRPRTSLAGQAGLDIENGIAVDQRLRTSAPDIWAAGDAASWPDPRSGERARVEHWVFAERMGQAAALSILGALHRFNVVPFFWSAHYDVIIDVVGHAPRWDRIELSGSLQDRDAAARLIRDDEVLALATLFRDRESLETELNWER